MESVLQFIPIIISSLAIIISGKTFLRVRKTEQLKLGGDLSKDLRQLDAELVDIKKNGSGKDIEMWDARVFNLLEWYSFLINRKEIEDDKIIDFYKETVIAYHDKILPEKDKYDPKKYPEFKKLYNRLKD